MSYGEWLVGARFLKRFGLTYDGSLDHLDLAVKPVTGGISRRSWVGIRVGSLGPLGARLCARSPPRGEGAVMR